MDPVNLEQLTDRRLRQLPAPRAPHTLLPRVMAAVGRLAGKPWYARTWFTWPLAGQVLSAGVVLSIVIALRLAFPALQGSIDAVMSRVSDMLLSPFAGVIEQLRDVAIAARVVWQSILHTVVVVLFLLVLLMFAACAAFGVALERVALGGTSRS
jgi:hypothetical protein